MRIKKYLTRDMQEAMNLIRMELGPDAVIISNRRLPRTLKDFYRSPQIEVTAAVEDVKVVDIPPAALPDEHQVVVPYTARTRGPRYAESSTNNEGHRNNLERLIPGHIQPTKLAEPLIPIDTNDWSFTSIFNSEMEKIGENSISEDLLNKWKKILKDREIHPRIVDRLLGGIEDAFTEGQPELDEIFKVTLRSRIARLIEPAYRENETARIYTFIGPTGVGKTTSLLKLATRKKIFEQKNIALLTVFAHRHGALEKLKYYGGIIGVPVEVVMTPSELRDAVESHHDKDLILIDTEGRPSKNTSQVLEIKSFLEVVGQPQDIFLVLSCTTRDQDLERIAVDFQKLKFSKLIFTKLDETDTYGSMLNIICKVGAPVSYITSGQNIPDDIKDMHHKNFAALIV